MVVGGKCSGCSKNSKRRPQQVVLIALNAVAVNVGKSNVIAVSAIAAENATVTSAARFVFIAIVMNWVFSAFYGIY